MQHTRMFTDGQMDGQLHAIIWPGFFSKWPIKTYMSRYKYGNKKNPTINP